MVRIVGTFSSRPDAELAVERLVQEHGLRPESIVVHPSGEFNSAGSIPAGADVESGHPGIDRSGRPALHGPINVLIDCDEGLVPTVEAALNKAGGARK